MSKKLGSVITISTSKGGVGKTTIATNLACCLAATNPDKNILILDLDGQSGVSMSFGILESKFDGQSFLDFLQGDKELPEIIFNDFKNEKDEHIENLYFIPSKNELWFFDRLEQKISDNFKLAINYLKQKFDYIIIDTQPSITSLNLLVYQVSNMIISPVEPEMQSVYGALKVINQIKSTDDLKPYLFVLPTKVGRQKYQGEILEFLSGVIQSENLNSNFAGAIISQNFIPFSTQFSSVNAKKRLPLYLTKSSAKFLVAQRETFENISKEILKILEQ